MDPRDFHSFADTLQRRDPSPAAIRSAISRGYYAVYHVAFDTLVALGFSPSEGRDGHEDVRKHLLESGDRTVKRLGHKIANLHGLRIDADYRLGNSSVETTKRAAVAIGQARKIIDDLDAIPASAQRATIIASITRWAGRKGN